MGLLGEFFGDFLALGGAPSSTGNLSGDLTFFTFGDSAAGEPAVFFLDLAFLLDLPGDAALPLGDSS